MKNIAIINALGISRYAFDPLSDGTIAFKRTAEYASQLPDSKKLVVLTDKKDVRLPDVQEKMEVIPGEIQTSADLLSQLQHLASGFDHLFYFYGDCPLLDIELTRDMYEKHLRYFAQYTFADGYPYGLTPEILKYEIIEPLAGLAGKNPAPVSRDTLFSVLQKDINSFDVETEISSKDMRLLRVALSCENKRNFFQTSRIIEAGGKDEESVIKVLTEKPELLRTFPAFAGIQIIDGCPQACSYCPYPQINRDVLTSRNEMSLEQFNRVLSQIFQVAEEAVISLSVWGEPGLHSQIDKFIDACLAYPAFSLIMETSGIGWENGAFQRIRELCGSREHGEERIDWIVSLDALDMKLYTSLRGKGYREAVAAGETLISLFPDHTYIQAVRMKGNEEDLEKFYRYWKEKTDNVIIQKYDCFSGFLEERKVTDLSPLKRFPCWHVKRDITVLLDGTVPLCREDLNNTTILGNLFEDSLETIWAAGVKEYKKHIDGNYSELCEQCDEYYTYNF